MRDSGRYKAQVVPKQSLGTMNSPIFNLQFPNSALLRPHPDPPLKGEGALISRKRANPVHPQFPNSQFFNSTMFRPFPKRGGILSPVTKIQPPNVHRRGDESKNLLSIASPPLRGTTGGLKLGNLSTVNCRFKKKARCRTTHFPNFQFRNSAMLRPHPDPPLRGEGY